MTGSSYSCLAAYWRRGGELQPAQAGPAQSRAAHARPGLVEVLNSLSEEQLPALVRGDCGFGNEPFIGELEDRNQSYLLKLCQTKGVQRLQARQFSRKDRAVPVPRDQGWSTVEDTLRLAGWDKSRRVVILRRITKFDSVLTRKTKGEQIELLLLGQDVQLWEYAVLVTSNGFHLDAIHPSDYDLPPPPPGDGMPSPGKRWFLQQLK